MGIIALHFAGRLRTIASQAAFEILFRVSVNRVFCDAFFGKSEVFSEARPSLPDRQYEHK